MKKKKNKRAAKKQNNSLLIVGLFLVAIGLVIFLIGAFLYKQMFFGSVIINLMPIGLIALFVGVLGIAIYYLTK